MADKTRIEQESIEVTLDDGTTAYQITTEVLEPGILPDTGLFVFRIVDPLDPKDDEFQRIAQPQDLNFMKRDRDQAITAGDDEFLYFKLVVQYDDLEVAIQAKAAIKSRIDSSISLWYQYETEFVGTAETLHPGVDPEFEQALKDAYKAARDARIAADAAVAEAEEALEDAQVALEHSEEIADIRKTEADFCLLANSTLWPQVQTGWGSFFGSANSLYADSKTLWNNANPFGAASDTFRDASETFFNDLILNYNSFTPGGPIAPYPTPPGATPQWFDFFNTFVGYDGTYDDYQILVTAFQSAVGTYGPHTVGGSSLGAFQTALDAYTTTTSLISSLNTALADFCATAAAAYNTALIDVSQKETAVTTSVAAKNEAEAEAASAQEAEDAALTAVTDVCPTFKTTDV